jgi:hypothetical protein
MELKVPNKNGEASNFATKTNYLNGRSKLLSNSKYRASQTLTQCKKCRSDYMRAAVDGYCQRCQQREEFIIREKTSGSEYPGRRGGGNR